MLKKPISLFPGQKGGLKMSFIKIYLIALLVFLVVDGLWLGLIAKNFYQKEIGFLLKESPNWIAAGVFYLFFIIGIVFFVINPAIEKDSWRYLIVAAFLFGTLTYATYDLTNLATIKDWPLKVTIIDIAWGGILTTIVSVVTYYFVGR